MHRLLLLILLMPMLATSQTRPVTLHEYQYLPFQPGQGRAGYTVALALDGDDLISTHGQWLDDGNGGERLEYFALWHQRGADGRWALRGRLVTDALQAANYYSPPVALRDGVAAIGFRPMTILERNASGWTRTDITTDYPDGQAIDVENGGILAGYGHCGWNARYFERVEMWMPTGTITGAARTCNSEQPGEALALSGSTALVYNRYVDGQNLDEARLYRRPVAGGAWPHVATLHRPPGETSFTYGGTLDLQGPLALISGKGKFGTHVFWNTAGDVWEPASNVFALTTPARNFPTGIRLDGSRLLQFYDGDPTVEVFEQTGDAQFALAGILWPAGGANPGSYVYQAAIRGTDAVLATGSGLYFFTLPSSAGDAPLHHDDFSAGNADGWQQTPGSGFGLSPNTGNRLYRQSSLAGLSLSIYSPWSSDDQSIEADIRPTEFQAPDRWVGLVTRFTDEANYYYVTMRSPGTIQLKRMANGQFTTLINRNFAAPVTAGRNYRVRLETIGSRLRVYVDGEIMMQTYDHALTGGRPGFATYRARADFDNVVMSALPRLESFNEVTVGASNYEIHGAGNWNEMNGYALAQLSAAGTARLYSRGYITDQSIEARITADAWAGGPGNRWFGLMARYVDENNYYYVTLRHTNEISIRKLVNGQIHVLATVPFQYSGTAYVRLDAVGDRLRAYVNGELLASASDATFQGGGSGIATYRTTATFDAVRAYQY